MKAVTARRTSAALALRAGFDGSKVLPFSELPGPKWPVLGAMPTMMSYGFSQLGDYYRDMYKTYGVIVDGNIAGEPTVIVYDPREFRKVFQLEGKYPHSILQDGNWIFERANAKTGIPPSGISLQGEAWHKARQALQKDIFNVAAASSYCLPVTNAAETVMTSVKAKVKAGEEVDFHKTMVNAIADVFTAAMFGKSAGMSDGSASEESQAWIQGAMHISNLTVKLLFQPYLKIWPEASSSYRAYGKRIGENSWGYCEVGRWLPWGLQGLWGSWWRFALCCAFFATKSHRAWEVSLRSAGHCVGWGWHNLSHPLVEHAEAGFLPWSAATPEGGGARGAWSFSSLHPWQAFADALFESCDERDPSTYSTWSTFRRTILGARCNSLRLQCSSRYQDHHVNWRFAKWPSNCRQPRTLPARAFSPWCGWTAKRWPIGVVVRPQIPGNALQLWGSHVLGSTPGRHGDHDFDGKVCCELWFGTASWANLGWKDDNLQITRSYPKGKFYPKILESEMRWNK